ncbi:hypothetical protein FHR22_004358 [Sphingopyxis panaciterrae]|uniref:hypothetical protein n=1 Tax=Sphingopyxis panaciterrae TaxID=363841 RepID=UPI001421E89A|nr:hypothetical protein [Sphingopyxis panaciterrae]NIJ39606.1 hypothetical protein [Sphingopyxis panaciterrae]
MRLFIAAAAAAWFGVAAPVQAQSVSIKNPAAFVATLKAMGYAPGALSKIDTSPEVDITVDGFGTTLRLVGCTAGADCKYMTLVASYSDVVNPPASWVQKMNDEFDLLRIGINDKGQLYMFGAYVIEGLPQRELGRIFDYWAADTSSIGQEAVDGGHTAKK